MNFYCKLKFTVMKRILTQTNATRIQKMKKSYFFNELSMFSEIRSALLCMMLDGTFVFNRDSSSFYSCCFFLLEVSPANILVFCFCPKTDEFVWFALFIIPWLSRTNKLLGNTLNKSELRGGSY